MSFSDIPTDLLPFILCRLSKDAYGAFRLTHRRVSRSESYEDRLRYAYKCMDQAKVHQNKNDIGDTVVCHHCKNDFEIPVDDELYPTCISCDDTRDLMYYCLRPWCIKLETLNETRYTSMR